MSRAPANPARELALTMADFDAGNKDYSDALRWLEVGSRLEPLSGAWERKRTVWARHAARRRSPELDPTHD